MSFRKDFAWGCATSSYQIEGAYNTDGKGLNIWDVFCKENGRVFEGHTGEIAGDHYHRYEEDIRLMASLGIKAYRFSINWARILPEGHGKVNEAGITFYNNLIDCLLKYDITPFITLFHWELPYELHKQGGWMNPQIVEWFGEYAALVSERFSDRVKHYFTINEPQCFLGLGYDEGIHAPGLRAPLKDQFAMQQNVLRAHGRAVQKLREFAKQPLLIGIAPTGSMCYPTSNRPEDIEAARQVFFESPAGPNRWTWSVSVWSDPVILGKFPEEFLTRFEAYLPHYSDADMQLISEKTDFYGQNIYNGKEIRCGKDGKPETVERKTGFPYTANNWPITPESLYWGPYFLYERYQKPIYITENGVASPDFPSLDGKIHDYGRINFLERYLGNLEKVADKIDLRGYFQWSLLDNFEWSCGYRDRFGIIYVDYDSQERIPKDSAYWYKEYIQKHSQHLRVLPIKQKITISKFEIVIFYTYLFVSFLSLNST